MTIHLDKLDSNLNLNLLFALIKIEADNIKQKFSYTRAIPEDILKLHELNMISVDVDGYSLTSIGMATIRSVLIDKVVTSPKAGNGNFDEFWATFPPNDKHGKWIRTRSLRSDKARSKMYYERAIAAGVTHENIMKALRHDIKSRKESSNLKNSLSFMKASNTWLYQAEYEVILEEIKLADQDPLQGDGDWTGSMI